MTRRPSTLLVLLSSLVMALACAPDCPPEQVAVHDQRHTRTLCMAALGANASGDSSTGDTSFNADSTDFTTIAPANCGDGIQDANEQCDDGNTIETDDCTNMCHAAACGDGIMWTDMEECDDANLDNTDNCLDSCLVATCGDGHVQTDMEECDDANSVDEDDCTNECKIACGNGIRSTDEECDDGNQINFDGCSEACTEEYIMFVTTNAVFPDFGGIQGADNICATAAAGKFAGTYVAWISVDGMDASSRLPMGKPLIRPDGQLIVATAELLLKGEILTNPIDQDMDGNKEPYLVLTGTTPQGTASGFDCNGWTSKDFALAADYGESSYVTAEWTNSGQIVCSFSGRLYCFRAAS